MIVQFYAHEGGVWMFCSVCLLTDDGINRDSISTDRIILDSDLWPQQYDISLWLD